MRPRTPRHVRVSHRLTRESNGGCDGIYRGRGREATLCRQRQPGVARELHPDKDSHARRRYVDCTLADCTCHDSHELHVVGSYSLTCTALRASAPHILPNHRSLTFCESNNNTTFSRSQVMLYQQPGINMKCQFDDSPLPPLSTSMCGGLLSFTSAIRYPIPTPICSGRQRI